MSATDDTDRFVSMSRTMTRIAPSIVNYVRLVARKSKIKLQQIELTSAGTAWEQQQEQLSE